MLTPSSRFDSRFLARLVLAALPFVGLGLVRYEPLQRASGTAWLLAQFLPWLFVFALMFAAIVLFRRLPRKLMAIAVVAVVLASSSGLSPKRKSRPMATPPLRVLSVNVACRRGAVRALEQQARDVDLVLVQELCHNLRDELDSALDRAGFQCSAKRKTHCRYSFRHPGGGVASGGIFARRPLEGRRVLAWEGQFLWPQVARLSWHGRTVAVWNLHYPGWGPWFTLALGWSGIAPDRWALSEIEGLQRQLTARLLAAVAQESGHATTILAGDFNSTQYSTAFSQITGQGFREAFAERGRGWPMSFPARLPVVRIDHLFARNLSPARAKFVRVRDSDHLGLRADLTLP